MLQHGFLFAPGFWMGGGPGSRCVGRVYGADGAVCMRLLREILCLRLSLLKLSFEIANTKEAPIEAGPHSL